MWIRVDTFSGFARLIILVFAKPTARDRNTPRKKETTRRQWGHLTVRSQLAQKTSGKIVGEIHRNVRLKKAFARSKRINDIHSCVHAALEEPWFQASIRYVAIIKLMFDVPRGQQ